MSRKDKLIERLLLIPKDFTWEEMINVLASFGFTEIKKGKTGGSRRKFTNSNKDIISLHKPHPKNIIKHYALKDVINFLRIHKYLQDE
jgi:predicted RNA binding protein YcfA (HicA-like mRNA interferase family)